MNEAVTSPAEATTLQSSDYFEKIPLWNVEGKSKRFEVLADELSGRMPVTRLESWRDFTDLLESDFFNRSGVQLVFRGHRRFDWSLMPTLGRLTTNGIVTEELAQARVTEGAAERGPHGLEGLSLNRSSGLRMPSCIMFRPRPAMPGLSACMKLVSSIW
ncbi:MAG: hypothetical protein HC900_07565, partial [Methylacidiphilales bacterium]|nr:hypothetical protein [Candidatus Methylacidiphilales bacterium]